MALGQRRDGELSGLRLPVVLAVVSLFVLVAFETAEAIHDRGALSNLRRSQDASAQEAINLRQQLGTLADGTIKLAAEGDEGAKAVLDQMKQQGIALNPHQKK